MKYFIYNVHFIISSPLTSKVFSRAVLKKLHHKYNYSSQMSSVNHIPRHKAKHSFKYSCRTRTYHPVLKRVQLDRAKEHRVPRNGAFHRVYQIITECHIAPTSQDQVTDSRHKSGNCMLQSGCSPCSFRELIPLSGMLFKI